MTDAATDGAATPEPSEESGSRSILRKSYGRTFRSSDSILLRSYAVVSALVGLFLIALVLLAMPIWIAQTAGQTALNMIGRALLPLVGLALLAPLVGPVLYAAKNRAAGAADRQGDAALAVAGYLFVASIYLALVISAPVEARTDPSGLIAPAIEFFYSLPPLAALAPPVLGAILIVAVQQWIMR